jgi:hypothetical protein
MTASLRQRFKVSWNDGEPVEIRTTVADLIDAVDSVPDESAGNRIALNTRLIYSALQRLGHQVGSYEEWIAVLDNYEELAAPSADPTPEVPSATEPSLSDASPEPTGDPGSDQAVLLRAQSGS